MKISLDAEILNVLMPMCRDLNISPPKLIKKIILEYYHNQCTKKVNKNGYEAEE